MLRALSALSVMLVCSSACGPQPTVRKTTEQEPVAADEPKSALDGASKAKRDSLLARMAEMKQETAEVLSGHAAGTLGDRLATGELLLIDAKAPASTGQIEYFVLPGSFTPPARSEPELRAAWKADKQHVQRQLVTGLEGARPGLLRKVAAGTYTVCAVVGPPAPPEREAFLAQAKLAFKAEAGGGPVDPAKLAAALRIAEQKAGFKRERVIWDTLPVRCTQAEVTGDAASRVVVLAPG